MSSDLHAVGINFKTTQPKIVYNDIKTRIIIELLTEGGHFQSLFILVLVFLPNGKQVFNYM